MPDAPASSSGTINEAKLYDLLIIKELQLEYNGEIIICSAKRKA
jgi:hypothetical protein